MEFKKKHIIIIILLSIFIIFNIVNAKHIVEIGGIKTFKETINEKYDIDNSKIIYAQYTGSGWNCDFGGSSGFVNEFLIIYFLPDTNEFYVSNFWGYVGANNGKIMIANKLN